MPDRSTNVEILFKSQIVNVKPELKLSSVRGDDECSSSSLNVTNAFVTGSGSSVQPSAIHVLFESSKAHCQTEQNLCCLRIILPVDMVLIIFPFSQNFFDFTMIINLIPAN